MNTIDLVRDVLYQEIEAYRHQDFQHFLIPQIGLRPHPEAELWSFGHARRFGYNRYIVSPFAGLEADLKLSRKRKSTSKLSESARARLHKMLDGVPRRGNPLDDRTYEPAIRCLRSQKMQQDWWTGNAQSFPLMALPREIRNAIYDATMDHQPKYVYGSGGTATCSRAVDRELLRVSKQAYTEYTEHFWLYSQVSFETWQTFAIWNQDQELVSRVKRLRLDLNFNNFLHLFGALPGFPDVMPRAEGLARQLRGWDLLSLDLHMQFCEIFDSEDDSLQIILEEMLDTIWPYVRGLSIVRLHCLQRPRQIELFYQACRRASIDYQRWKKRFLDDGAQAVGLKAYDTWLSDLEGQEDGGVCLPGSVKELPLTNWRQG